jgi:hypothetical protein
MIVRYTLHQAEFAEIIKEAMHEKFGCPTDDTASVIVVEGGNSGGAIIVEWEN